MNQDTITHALEFLRAPDLLTLTACAAWVAPLLTEEMVLRAALRTGKSYGRESLENVMALYGKGKIHRPSPLRLLRLVNGRCCERHGCSQKLTRARKDWGVYLCWDCTKRLSHGLKLHQVTCQRMYGAFARHPRLCATEHTSQTFIWKTPLVKKDGERVGPVLTLQEVGETARTAALALCEEKPCSELIQMYETYHQESVGREKEKAVQTAMKKKSAAEEKKRKVDSIYEQVGSLNSLEARVLKSRLLAPLFEPYVKAPSKATKKKIKFVADEATAACSTIQETFENMEFLGDSALAIALREEAALIDPTQILLGARASVLRKLEAGRPKEAVCDRLVNCQVASLFAKKSCGDSNHFYLARGVYYSAKRKRQQSEGTLLSLEDHSTDDEYFQGCSLAYDESLETYANIHATLIGWREQLEESITNVFPRFSGVIDLAKATPETLESLQNKDLEGLKECLKDRNDFYWRMSPLTEPLPS